MPHLASEHFALVIDRFRKTFGTSPDLVTTAPGRMNLIGEHTDYNDGFVLPAAIDRSITVAAQHVPGIELTAHASMFGETKTARLDSLRPLDKPSWMNYVAGVAYQLQLRGAKLTGGNLYIEGTVPLGAGLSSSAALEAAVAHALLAISGSAMAPAEIALACQQAEHTFAAVNCGIMDQFVSLLGRKGRALFLDCRSFNYELIPVPSGIRFVICDTAVSRELAASAYNERRTACERGVHALQRKYPAVHALRDVTSVMLDDFHSRLDAVVYRRCRHVVTENERVLQSVRALRNGDLSEFGKLMYQSHVSLARDYEVSCPELDAVVDICAEEDEVYGARMTGAGFGGSAICMVREDHADRVARRLAAEYPVKTGRTPNIFICSIEDGATVHPL